MDAEEKVVLYVGNKIALMKGPNGYRLPFVSEVSAICHNAVLRRVGGIICGKIGEDSCSSTADIILSGLRESYLIITEEEYIMAAKVSELLYWDSQTRYCGVCGAEMNPIDGISKRCSACGREVFPALSPAILVLVKRGEEALLVHARNFKRNFYGLVAGFVETGESLEECVAREVKEETTLEIKNIRYFGSQSWPFPANLMIGFVADYSAGELCFADDELSSGGFFKRDDLPELATPPSLARSLIDAWIEGKI
jgi:NAD+ diphosphatase